MAQHVDVHVVPCVALPSIAYTPLCRARWGLGRLASSARLGGDARQCNGQGSKRRAELAGHTGRGRVRAGRGRGLLPSLRVCCRRPAKRVSRLDCEAARRWDGQVAARLIGASQERGECMIAELPARHALALLRLCRVPTAHDTAIADHGASAASQPHASGARCNPLALLRRLAWDGQQRGLAVAATLADRNPR